MQIPSYTSKTNMKGIFKMVSGRVLARISKMPVQNSNFKISARPD